MKLFIIYFTSIQLLLSGIGLLIIGSLGNVWLNVISDILGIYPYMTSFLSLVLGTIMVVFGAVMIAKPDNLKLSFYVGIAAIILMGGIGTATVLLRDNIVQNAVTGFIRMFDDRIFYGARFDAIQQDLQCCGRTGPQNFNPQPIPASCCPTNALPCTAPFNMSCNRAFYYHVGLITAMIGYTNLGLAGLIALSGLVLGIIYYIKKK